MNIKTQEKNKPAVNLNAKNKKIIDSMIKQIQAATPNKLNGL